MNLSVREMPEKVQKSVLSGTVIVNIVLLLCHISFGFLFYCYKADALFRFNCISIATYIIAFEILRRRKTVIYIFVVFIEIFLFMLHAVIYLGWEYGFQHYCIGFVASMMFSDYFANRSKIVKRRTVLLGSVNVVIYISLKFWTYLHPPIYTLGSDMLVRTFYVFNTVFGFAFLIMYFIIYSDTVAKLENELFEMANNDSLTGLCNRRKMTSIIKANIEEENIEKFALAMLDVDYFKKTNDTYGHDAGDEVLKSLARLLVDNESEVDKLQVSRWGGEEFLVLYRQYSSKEEVLTKFEEIRKNVEMNEVCYGEDRIKVSITIGIAFYEQGKTMDSLIKEADTNLYEGKENGRNQVVSS